MQGEPANALGALASVRHDGEASPRLAASGWVLAAAAARRLRMPSADTFARRAKAMMGVYQLTTPLLLVPSAERDWFVALTRLPLPPTIFGSLPERPVLSPREEAVLFSLSQHRSREELAGALHVSLNTVKSQLSAVYQKLGVSNREEALAKAGELRLLQLNHADIRHHRNEG